MLSDAAPFAVANWPCEEASGNLLDSINGYDLAESGTGGIGTSSGLFSGNARDFESGDSDQATIADNADLSGGDVDLTWIFWLRAETELGANVICYKGNGTGQDEYDIRKNDYVFRLRLWGSASFGDEAIVETAQEILPATNYLLCCKHDSVNNVIGISYNGANWTTTAHSAGIYNSAQQFRLGVWDGLMKEATILRGYCLSDTELSELWNSGDPIPFADWAGGGAVTATPSTASLTLATFAPTVSTPRLCTPTTKALALTTFAPTVSTPRVCTPGAASLTLSTFAPDVSTPVTVTPSPAALTLTTLAPTVTAEADVVASPQTASLTLTTFAPVLGGSQTFVPGAASLTLTTLAPTVSTPRLVTPGTLALALSSFAPTIQTPVVCTPTTAALSLTAFAPTVTGSGGGGGGGTTHGWLEYTVTGRMHYTTEGRIHYGIPAEDSQ